MTLSRFARRFWFCPYGTTGFGFLDGRPEGTKGICWVDRDSVTGVFGGRRAGYSVDCVGAVRVIVVGGLVGGMGVGGFVRGPVTLSRFARRFWFCPYGTTGFGFLDGRPEGTKGICWVARDSVTGVFCGTIGG